MFILFDFKTEKQQQTLNHMRFKMSDECVMKDKVYVLLKH